MSVSECVDRFIADRESMKLGDPMMRKYWNACQELKDELGNPFWQRS